MLVPPFLPAGSLNRHDQPSLDAGGGLTLRPWRPADAPRMIEAFADPAIRYWHMRSVDDDDEAVELIADWRQQWIDETDANWAITQSAGDDVVGRVALRGIDLPAGRAECSYWVLPGARGRGTAAAAVVAMGRWALAEAGFHRLFVAHSVANLSSCRVAEKAGFAAEGTLRGHQLHDDGWHDVHLHGRVRTDLERENPIETTY